MLDNIKSPISDDERIRLYRKAEYPLMHKHVDKDADRARLKVMLRDARPKDWQYGNEIVLLAAKLLPDLFHDFERATADAKRLDWLIRNHESIGFASGDREPSAWVDTKELRKRIDAVMRDA